MEVARSGSWAPGFKDNFYLGLADLGAKRSTFMDLR